MSYLNPPYPNNFQELCAAMPLFYLDVREMRAILRAQGYLLDGLCDGMEQVVDYNFIHTADEATIKKWERALKITYKGKLTLDQRKRVVIGYIIGLGHIGEPEIRTIIALYTNSDVSVGFLKGVVSIVIDGFGTISGYANLLETIYNRIPTHLALAFTVNVRSPTPAVLRLGGDVGSQTQMGIPQQPDNYNVHTVLHTGGTGSVHAVLPILEDAATPPATTILRTGGVCTIISNLSKGE